MMHQIKFINIEIAWNLFTSLFVLSYQPKQEDSHYRRCESYSAKFKLCLLQSGSLSFPMVSEQSDLAGFQNA